MEDGKQSVERDHLIDLNKLAPICNQEGIILKSLLKSLFEIALLLKFHHLLSRCKKCRVVLLVNIVCQKIQKLISSITEESKFYIKQSYQTYFLLFLS